MIKKCECSMYMQIGSCNCWRTSLICSKALKIAIQEYVNLYSSENADKGSLFISKNITNSIFKHTNSALNKFLGENSECNNGNTSR